MKVEILQIKDLETCPYAFRSYNPEKFNLKDYAVVHSYQSVTEEAANEPDELLLEDIFRLFNRVTEEDCVRLEKLGFRGHSLSMSDLVAIDDRLYYCDMCGWTRIGVIYGNTHFTIS